MRKITYCIYREDDDFVSQCLNVGVSSFGSSREEAQANLKEAVELYSEDSTETNYHSVADAIVGEELIHASTTQFQGDHRDPQKERIEYLVSQEGSHRKYENSAGRVAVVPHPKKQLPIGTTKSVIRQSGLDPSLFGY